MTIGGRVSEAFVRKPPYGSACNGCGACCMVARCPLGQHVFGLDEIGPCPALTKTSETMYACGLVLDPKRYAPARAARNGVNALRRAALLLIGAGDGCDARLAGEKCNQAYADALDAYWCSREAVKASRRAKQLWIGAIND
jgi:hypothetical protein